MAAIGSGWADGAWTAAGWVTAAWLQPLELTYIQGMDTDNFWRHRRILRGARLDLPNKGMIEGTLQDDGEGYRLGDSERGFMGRRRVPK